MSYRVHPETAWVHDPATNSIHVVPLPAGEAMTIGGTGCLIFLDVAEGRDPIIESLNRWDAPEDEVRSSVEHFLQSLVQSGVLLVDGVPRRDDQESTDAPEAAGPAPVDEASSTPKDVAYRLLFVCTGNICRSAYAEARMHQLATPGLDVASAGTQALVGEPVDACMAQYLSDPAAAARHQARQISLEMVRDADLILAMSERHLDFIIDEWPHAASKTFLLKHVANTLPLLPEDARIDDVAPFLWTHRGMRGDESIRDPYRRGDEVAAKTARAIDACLDVLAPTLGQRMQGERP